MESVGNGESKVEGVSVTHRRFGRMLASVSGAAAIHHPTQQSVSHSGAPLTWRGAIFRGRLAAH